MSPRRACPMPCMILIVADLDTTRSRAAHNTNVGTEIWLSAAVSSTASSSAIRRRTTAVVTPAIARSDWRGALDGEVDPHISGARIQRGKDFRGRKAASRRAHAKLGKGLLAKVTHRIRPLRPGGGRAAMRMAVGPEKDSPRSTKGGRVGNAARKNERRR